MKDEPEYKHYLFNGSLYGSPVEIRLGCVTEHISQRQHILDSFYVFRNTQVGPAEVFMNRLVKELTVTYGPPKEGPLERHRADGTVTSIGRNANFGCFGDARMGYSLNASLRYPARAQTDYEVWLYMRYGGGVC